MAAESTANRNARVLREDIDQMIEWTELQYNYLDYDIVDLLDKVINPRYAKKISSTHDPDIRQRYIHDRDYVLKTVFKIRGHKEDTGRTDHTGYEKLLIDLKNLREELSGNSNSNRIKEKLTRLEEKFKLLNFELNKFVKTIKKLLPDVNIRRVTSQHTRLNHRRHDFKFLNLNENRDRSPSRPSRSNNGTRRGRSRNRSNSSHSRNRSRSAIRNRSRAPRGSIRISEIAREPLTYAVGSRGNMTFTSDEIRRRAHNEKLRIAQEYGDIGQFKNVYRNANRVAAEAAEIAASAAAASSNPQNRT